jgi:hypothetical protein
MSTRLFIPNYDLPFAAPRIVRVDISRFDVEGYDIDNGYPQRMQSLIKASPTGKMATRLYASYIFGQGFNKDDAVWNTVFNSRGHTGDDLLALAAKDYSEFEKFWVHVNYNALFQGVELRILPFEQCRYGTGDRAGTIAVYNNWWNNNRFGSLRKGSDEPDYIDEFNPDPAAIKDQVRRSGGWSKYKGQMFEFSKSFERYPECTLDAGIEAMQAEILSYKTTKANLKNNFGDKVIWKEKGKFANDAEREEFRESVQKFVGPEGESVIIAEVEREEDAPEITTIENKLDDKKFSYSDTKVRSTIYRLLGQNAILHSDLTEGRYNQNQLPEAIKAYNNFTERDRINMQRAFKQLFALCGIETEAAITPLNDLISATQNTEGANNNGATTTPDMQG